ncbi:MAG: tRNA-dihydrouridine synthase [Patescibacteria group bacterium]
MIKKPFAKSNLPLIGLSPMAGYTDSAYRTICRELGADFVVTELISADGVIQNYASLGRVSKTLRLMRFSAKERPIFIQLFGADPEKMKLAAQIIAKELKPDGIDINMGCPAHKVVCSGHGSALMKNPALAAEIVKSVKEGSGLPVSVKTRLGWSDSSNLNQFVVSLANAGADMIAIHGRTYEQGFSGKADYEPIYEAKKLVSIPVLGNGDIWSAGDALDKIGNLDGLLIGRGAVGNPWIFAEVKEALTTKQVVNHPINWQKRFELLKTHVELKYQQDGKIGIVEMRKILPAYLKGLPNAAKYRQNINSINTVEDVKKLISEILGS